MKQLLQNLKNGHMDITEVPVPMLHSKGVLVRNYYSLISSGTEKSKVKVARKGYIGKAAERPDLVKKVLDNVKTQGLKSTYLKIMGKLKTPAVLGYSSSGIVIGVGDEVSNFKIGDRVACAGAGYANHSEVIYAPQNLCAKIPEGVSFEEAAFTTVACIALQGIRQSNVKIGENVAVIGLGLIGQLTVQMLKAAGCKVAAYDPKEYCVAMSKKNGVDSSVSSISEFEKLYYSISNGYGVDATLITAATSSNEPIEVAGRITRKKGKVIVVGAVKMDIPRSPYYEKELDVCISCSYGIGRYDNYYEELGIDYPYAYARWTENRNMQAVLMLLNDKKIKINNILTHTFDFKDSLKAYEIIMKPNGQDYMAMLLKYDTESDIKNNIIFRNKINKNSSDNINISLIGAGNFAKGVLLPAVKNIYSVNLRGILTSSGYTAKGVGDNFNFDFYTSEENCIMTDEKADAVMISTRHDSHGRLVIEALKNNKAVFVEKPLAMKLQELKEILSLCSIINNSGVCPRIMVGYNRRFSDSIINIKSFFKDSKSPLFMNYRVNAGYIADESWIQNEVFGGGRIIGEVCHFIDTMQYLTDANPVKVYSESIKLPERTKDNLDVVNISITFNDGSIGVINYLSNGDTALEKERLEVFSEGKTAIMNDFKEEQYYALGKKKVVKHLHDKGHNTEIKIFIEKLIKGEPMAITLESIIYTSYTTFKILNSIKNGTIEKIDINELFDNEK